ncbi:MAG: flagellar filament capping protein FliD [Acidobacteria bacterium]|nr:flagellar filament capping protein FliD [Acidobacteriota bacterium]
MGTFGIDLSSLTGTTGIDVNTLVAQLSYVARAPERVWQNHQQGLQVQINALTELNTGLADLLTKINNMKDLTGGLGAVLTTSSDSAVVNATATPGAVIGTHTVIVNTLATTASYYSAAVATGDTALNNGSFTIQLGSNAPTTITIDSTNNTLNKLAASINSANLGVTANVTTDVSGARLALVANTSGASSDITITNDTSGMGFTKAASGKDATLTVDGVPITSSSNTVTGVIPNVSFSLSAAAPGEQVAIGISPDTEAAVQAVTDFVDSYNTIAKQMADGFRVDTTSHRAGALVGDTSADILQQHLLDMSTYSVGGAGAFTTLRSLGITIGNDGTMAVDKNALTKAANSDYANFKNFFQSTDGFASFFSKRLTEETSPTQGLVSVDMKGLQATQQSLQKQVDDFEQFLLAQQQQWQKQYEQANIILQQLPQLQKQIESQLGTLSTSSSK